MKHAPFLAAVLCLLTITTSKVSASAETQIDSALTVAKTWVGEIDAGQYDDCYSSACDAMHDKVPADKWTEILKTLRTPWGPVTNRKQISHVYKGDGFEGTPGEFMVITYDSSFKNVDTATEVVVLKWDSGKWRGAGYNARIKSPTADDGGDIQPPQSTTETQTQEHVKPPPQSH